MPRPPRHPIEIDRRAPRPVRVEPARRRPRRWVLTSVALWLVVATGTLAFAASLAVPLWFQARDQRLLIVTSGSMAPVFDAGDAVVMRKVDDPSQLKVGQIISFWPLGSEQLVTHRVVDLVNLPTLVQDEDTGEALEVRDPVSREVVTSPYVITKGDANTERDPNATPITRVRGIVLDVHPGWGWVLEWAGSAVGRAVMLVPPLLALGTLELLSVREGRRTAPRTTPPDERYLDAVLHG